MSVLSNVALYRQRSGLAGAPFRLHRRPRTRRAGDFGGEMRAGRPAVVERGGRLVDHVSASFERFGTLGSTLMLDAKMAKLSGWAMPKGDRRVVRSGLCEQACPGLIVGSNSCSSGYLKIVHVYVNEFSDQIVCPCSVQFSLCSSLNVCLRRIYMYVWTYVWCVYMSTSCVYSQGKKSYAQINRFSFPP